MKKSILLTILSAVSCFAQITNVQLQIVSTHGVVQFTAPDTTTACTVDVTQTFTGGTTADYAKPVEFLNTTRFPTANVVAAGTRNRTFYIGAMANVSISPVDNWTISRALQQDARHAYRITCGGSVYNGEFYTPSRPNGLTWAPRHIVDAVNPGAEIWPTIDFADKTQEVRDPLFGSRMVKVSGPEEQTVEGNGTSKVVFAWQVLNIDSDAGWTGLVSPHVYNDSGYATAIYQGSTQAKVWLDERYDVKGGGSVDFLRWTFTDSCGEGVSAADRTVNMCVNLDSDLHTCESDIRTVVLPQVSVGASCPSNTIKVPSGPDPIWDMWRSTDKVQMSQYDIDSDPVNAVPTETPSPNGASQNQNFGFLMWKATASTDKITLNHFVMDLGTSLWSGNYSGGFSDFANTNLDQDGAYKMMVSGNGLAVLYAVYPKTGEHRRLGKMPGQCETINTSMWSKTDPDVMYCNSVAGNGIERWKYAPALGHYNEAAVGRDVIVPVSGKTIMTSVSAKLSAWMAANRPPDGVTYPSYLGCDLNSVQGDASSMEVVVRCALGQDKVSFLGVVHLDADKATPDIDAGSNTGVIAVFPTYFSDCCRWTVNHAAVPDCGPNTVCATLKFAKLDVVHGETDWRWTLVNGVSGSETHFIVTSANDGTGGTPRNAEPSGLLFPIYIMDSKPGDLMRMGNEILRLVSKNSYNSTTNQWDITVLRNASTDSQPNGSVSAGQTMTMWAAPLNYSGEALFGTGTSPAWHFRTDPHALDIHHFKTPQSHPLYRGQYLIGGDGAINDCGVGHIMADECVDSNPNWPPGVPYSYVEPVGISIFAGAESWLSGNSVEKHPSYSQDKAPESERHWFIDVLPALGGSRQWTPVLPNCDITLQGVPDLTGGGGPCMVQRVPGTTNTYRVRHIGFDIFNAFIDLDWKKLPVFAQSGGSMLRNVSGPSCVVNDSNLYRIGIVLRAGECFSGSVAGEIYVSAPGVTTNGCGGGEFAAIPPDFCVGNLPATLNTLMQMGIAPDAGDNRYTRPISTLLMNYRSMAATINARTIPDGSWANVNIQKGRTDMWGVKMTGSPAHDMTRRDSFVQVPWTFTPPPSLGVDNAIVEFGYDSRLYCNGQDANGTWDGRSEICVKGNQSVASCSTTGAAGNAPGACYDFAGDTVTGVPCTTSCTISIPAIAQRILHWRVVYRNGTTRLAVGQIQSQAVQ